jgi:hypothetical protein
MILMVVSIKAFLRALNASNSSSQEKPRSVNCWAGTVAACQALVAQIRRARDCLAAAM